MSGTNFSVSNWLANNIYNNENTAVRDNTSVRTPNISMGQGISADSFHFSSQKTNPSVSNSNSIFQFLSFNSHAAEVDNTIAQLSMIPDTNERSIKLRDLFINLIDKDDFTGASKVINATPSLIFRNSMFKGLVQELTSSGNYQTAVTLVNNYPDARIKAEMKAFIVDYINSYGNDSTWAAKAEGDESILNVAKLKTENIIGSVGSFFGDVGGSVSSLWSNPTRSNQLARSAESLIGKQFRYASLDYGNLACAYSVSQMLKKVPGLEKVGSAECNELARQLSQNGFKKAYSNGYSPIKGKIEYKAGDVVFFSRNGKDGYGHVGMVAEVKNGIPYMVHNSSSKREVVKVRLDQYYKTPVAVYRA